MELKLPTAYTVLFNYRSLFKDCWMSHSKSVVFDSESVYVYAMDLILATVCVCVCVCVFFFVGVLCSVLLFLSSMDPCDLIQIND